MKNIEVEIKLQLQNPNIFLKWINDNAILLKQSSQTDYYFDPPHKSFIYIDKDGYKDADEWFRLRVSKDNNEICYKYWHRNKEGKSLYADEIETKIGDPKQILEILNRLGFKLTSTIEKERTSYKYNDFQFDCDNVKNLGFFIEIEWKGEADNPEEGKQKIYDLLDSIKLNQWQKTKRGYSWIQWNPDKNHYEDGF